MKKMLLIAYLLLSSTITFAQEDLSQEVYKSLEGLWNTPSDGDMDIILNVDNKGDFTLSIIPAFEFTNMTTAEQSKIIDENVVEEGYFKVIKNLLQDTTNNILSASMEILLNGELTTNDLVITSNQVFIINTNDSTNNTLKELFLLR